MWKKLNVTGFALILMLSMVLAACGNGNGSTNGESGSQSGTGSSQGKSSVDLGQKNLKVAYVAWESAIASNNVMKQVLENLGYNVTLKQTTTGPMYASVANGSVDFMIDSWLPTTDANYWKKYKDQLVDVGISVKKCPEGLVVPKYVKADSVKDLAQDKNNIGEKTNWTITGIDAGAGEMEIIRKKMMPEYGLKGKWHLQASSSSAMLAALKSAIDQHKPIVTVLWSPHWAFSQWDLKFLKDPKDVFEKPDDIHTLARKGLKQDAPAAYKVLKQFHWTKKDLEKVMSMIHNGMQPEEAAQKWIQNHQKLVNQWTKGVKK
ncbi:MAG TPA: glycine betaine ABC transporter substrate-binding protein [Bacillales bacterium]|nr:glycine betaine ABC transporter substrate-binding protein [Bacillales bacterium]